MEDVLLKDLPDRHDLILGDCIGDPEEHLLGYINHVFLIIGDPVLFLVHLVKMLVQCHLRHIVQLFLPTIAARVPITLAIPGTLALLARTILKFVIVAGILLIIVRQLLRRLLLLILLGRLNRILVYFRYSFAIVLTFTHKLLFER